VSAWKAANERATQAGQVRGRELEEVREKDPDGRIVVHPRPVDTLGKMLRSGTIDQSMHDAAKDFQAAFIVAQLDPLRALPALRVPGTGREPELNERQVDARRRVHETLQALGGIPARRTRAYGRSSACSGVSASGRSGKVGAAGTVRQEQAQGILVAALGMLAGAFRL
jgi:hypothetical protein